MISLFIFINDCLQVAIAVILALKSIIIIIRPDQEKKLMCVGGGVMFALALILIQFAQEVLSNLHYNLQFSLCDFDF